MIVLRRKVSILLMLLQNKIVFFLRIKINFNDMTSQFESIFKDLAENINLEDIENMDGAITFGSQNSDDPDAPKISGAAIPIGSIFSNMFSNNQNNNEEQEPLGGRKKVKVERKKK